MVRFSCARGSATSLIAPAARSAKGAAQSSITTRKTILVVDDHAVVRDMFAGFLRGLGYGVLEADGPLEAQQMSANDVKIDLLLTDFRMPEMNGVELARWFRERFPMTKLMVVSSTPWEVEPYFTKTDSFALLEKSEAFARLPGLVEQLLTEVPELTAEPVAEAIAHSPS